MIISPHPPISLLQCIMYILVSSQLACWDLVAPFILTSEAEERVQQQNLESCILFIILSVILLVPYLDVN